MDKPLSSPSASPVPYWEVVERALAPSRRAPAAPPTVYVSDLLARQSARLLELAEREAEIVAQTVSESAPMVRMHA